MEDILEVDNLEVDNLLGVDSLEIGNLEVDKLEVVLLVASHNLLVVDILLEVDIPLVEDMVEEALLVEHMDSCRIDLKVDSPMPLHIHHQQDTQFQTHQR